MNDKVIKISGILFLLIIPFHTLFESFISSVFVLPILSKIDSSLPNDFVALILLLLLLHSLKSNIKKNVFISNNYIFFLTLLSLVYIYYRLFDNVWDFTQFNTISKLAYSDLVLVFSMSEWTKKLFYKTRISKAEPKKGFLFDNPLGKNDNDKLQREDYAKTICEKIKNTENNKSAFSIGLNGDWGVGKTSFIDLIKRNLDNSENIIFDFNPWLNNGASSIINEFFKMLSYEVNIYNPSLANKIELYGKLLLQFGDSKLNKAVNPILHLNTLNTVAQTQYTEINSSISKLNKKLIIFIDDLDRLDNNEIIEVIRIIRNTANFANTIFIAAYDRNYLINALKKINSHNSEFFLEKIFQVEIHLPDYEIKTIKKRVFDLIENNLTSEDRVKLNSLFFDKNNFYSINFSHKYSENIIRTIRDATRFANSFNLSYSHLKGEVNIKDLYYLELLKLKYPGVYNIILQEKDNFLTLYDDDSSGFSYRNSTFYSLKKDKHKHSETKTVNQEMDFSIEFYLNENASSIGINKKSIPSIIDILKFLFPEKKSFYNYNELEPLSLADPKCFNRYSYYRLLDENLSQVEFNNYLDKDTEEFKKVMHEWVSKGLRSEISDKFRRIKNFKNKKEFEKTILAIFNFARIPSQSGIVNDYSGYDYHDLRNKIDNTGGKLSDELYDKNESELVEFLKAIFDNAPLPYKFEISFIREVLKSYDYAGFNLDKDYLNGLRLTYFSNYLNSLDKIDIPAFHLYHDCDLTNIVTVVGLESMQVESSSINIKANDLFKEFIKNKDLDGFLYWMIESERYDMKGYCISQFVTKLFGSFIDFRTFLNQFKVSDHQYLEEFLEFYDEFEKVNFKNYIEFNFKKIPLRE